MPGDQVLEGTMERILGHVKEGVTAFTEAHPVAHISIVRLTEATTTLARSLVPAGGREQTRQKLRGLAGDPALRPSLILRAFAGAAIAKWALEDFPEFPGLPATSVQQQTLLMIKQYLPALSINLTDALEVEYFDSVIAPKLPHLARRFQLELYDILFSLRAPLEPPFDTPTGHQPEDVQAFPERDRRLRDWQIHIENAFLEALQLRLMLAKTGRLFDFELSVQGTGYEDYTMKPLCRIVAEATPENSVLLCLSPIIRSSARQKHMGGGRQESLNVKTYVILEGLQFRDL